MDPGRGHDHPASRHRRRFSLNLSFRSSSRRRSVIDPPDVQPTCEEREHYPIFNPNDPRHNPQISHSWRRRDSQTSSSDSQRHSHSGHVHTLRSLHRARSGLLALTANLFHRTSHQSIGSDELEVPRRGPSSLSTQEDLAFGVNLYRTPNALHNSADTETSMEALMRVAAFPPLGNIASAPERLGSSRFTIIDPDETLSVGDNFGGHVAAWPQNGSKTVSHVNEGRQPVTVYPASPAISKIEEAPSVPSEENILKPKSRRPSTLDEGISVPSDPSNIIMYDDGSVYCDNMEKVCFEGDRICPPFKFDIHNRPSSESLESARLSEKDALSTLSSNTPYRRSSNFTQSETFASQERLQTIHNTSCSESLQSRLRISQGSSADVRIAFPTLYQELVEQWKREQMLGDALDPYTVSEEARAPAPKFSISTEEQQPGFTDMNRQNTNAYASVVQPRHLPSDFESVCVMRMFEPQSYESQPSYINESLNNSALSICDMIQDIGGSRQSTPVADTQRPGSRHSFGLHMSHRNEVRERPSSSSHSQQTSPPRIPCQQASVGEPYTFSPTWQLGTSPASPCDSEYTYGDMTSPSSALWSPLDSPIDEEILFSNYLRDEYYMIDGKGSTFRPDQGSQPVKSEESRIVGDGRIHSGPGLDRIHSVRRTSETRPSFGWTRPQPVSEIIHSMSERQDSESSESIYRRPFINP